MRQGDGNYYLVKVGITSYWLFCRYWQRFRGPWWRRQRCWRCSVPLIWRGEWEVELERGRWRPWKIGNQGTLCFGRVLPLLTAPEVTLWKRRMGRQLRGGPALSWTAMQGLPPESSFRLDQDIARLRSVAMIQHRSCSDQPIVFNFNLSTSTIPLPSGNFSRTCFWRHIYLTLFYLKLLPQVFQVTWCWMSRPTIFFYEFWWGPQFPCWGRQCSLSEPACDWGEGWGPTSGQSPPASSCFPLCTVLHHY